MTVVSMFSVPLIHYEIANWHIAKKKIKEALPDIQESMLESNGQVYTCLLYTSPSPRDSCASRMPSSA